MSAMESSTLQAVLERWQHEKIVRNVVSVTQEPAVAHGENFLSSVTRLTLKVVLGNGRSATRHLILKERPKGNMTSRICKSVGIFNLETKTYLETLKGMEYLMEEFGDTDDVLWCQLIHHEPFNSILFEDLQDYGYKMINRQSQMGFDHAVLALRSLGRFHAMTKVLEERGIICKYNYRPFSLLSEKEAIRSFFYKGYQALCKGIIDYWGDEWKNDAEQLEIPEEIIAEKLIKIGKLNDNFFNVLNHGDCWSNNMMFKHNWKGEPIAVRFLDFQSPHYNSPAIDLTYFLHLSIEPVTRKKFYDVFIEQYHESLISSLNKYQYKGSSLTLPDLRDEMDRVSFFGLSMFAIRHAVFTTPLTDAMDLEKIFVSGGEEGLNPDIYKDLNLKTRMGPDLKYLLEYLNNNA